MMLSNLKKKKLQKKRQRTQSRSYDLSSFLYNPLLGSRRLSLLDVHIFTQTRYTSNCVTKHLFQLIHSQVSCIHGIIFPISRHGWSYSSSQLFSSFPFIQVLIIVYSSAQTNFLKDCTRKRFR